jgi:predicted nuclease of restriction endonuclease-like RecB superfamily
MPSKRTKKKAPEFKSRLEKVTWEALIKNKHVKVKYEDEHLPYSIQRNYIPDFICILPDGRKIYIESKGYFRQEDRAKMNWVLKCHPNLDIRFVFSQDNKIAKRKNGVYKYSDWCKKRGIKYSIGSVPKEWFR